jgi:PEP-CTERM motif
MDNGAPTAISVAMSREGGTLRRNLLDLSLYLALLWVLCGRSAVAGPIFQHKGTLPATGASGYTTPGTDLPSRSGSPVSLIDIRSLADQTDAILPVDAWLATGLASGIATSASALEAAEPGEPPAFGISVKFRASLPSHPVPGASVVVGQSAPVDAPSDLLTIPEPASVVLLVTGLVGIWARRYLRRRFPSDSDKGTSAAHLELE